MRKKNQIDRVQVVFKLLISFFIGLSIALFIRQFICFTYEITDAGMKPNLSIGSRVVMIRSNPFVQFELGDIVMVEYPGVENQIILSRIIGIPGDTVQIKDKKVFRNFKTIPENYNAIFEDLRTSIPIEESNRDNIEQIKIKRGEYYLLSDNRDSSVDSREIGSIHRDQIIGFAWK